MLSEITKAIYYLEDFVIFKEVQLQKYKSTKQNILNENSPEMVMVIDLIKDYWCDLLATGYINNKNKKEKERIFSSINIIFPYSEIPASWLDGIQYVDFRSYSS